ncbi:putative heavy metal-associated domain superfamily [Helianthus annuus]|nr:putative heavy metal-associated domain superfamily [Helianthus annuus]
MQWIKAYKDHKVDLVGDDITKGRTWNIQMLYEFGIRSTYLQGIKDQSMATHQYTSSSFRVPLHPKKHKIHGLSVTALYRSLVEDINTELPLLFAKISNRSRGVSWVYSPVVYCKPRVDEDVVWLSYWPIGNLLDAGDDVYVDIIAKKGTITSGYGASLVYKDGDEVEKEEEKSEEEVIGGDLSRFEVTKGGYYLCRLNFFNSIIPATLFGERIQISGKIHEDGEQVVGYLALRKPIISETPITTHVYTFTFVFCHPCNLFAFNVKSISKLLFPFLFFSFLFFTLFERVLITIVLIVLCCSILVFFQKCKVTLGVNFNSESEIKKIEKAVSSVPGVESVYNDKEIGRMIVIGRFDHQAVVTCVRGFEKMVQVLQRKLLEF